MESLELTLSFHRDYEQNLRITVRLQSQPYAELNPAKGFL
jgi:hypothetical protein